MTEIEELIREFNIDPTNTKIREYYAADNIWKSVHIERNETAHSAFIAWLLGKDYPDWNGPLYYLLNLLIGTSNRTDSEFVQLKNAVLRQKLKFGNVEIRTEKRICDLSNIRYTDRLDIYIKCQISGLNSTNEDDQSNSEGEEPSSEKGPRNEDEGNRVVPTILEIFIENKIDSFEGKNKLSSLKASPTPDEIKYKGLKQTGRYYFACSKDNDGKGGNCRKRPFDAAHTIQLFVFLTEKDQNPSDVHFEKISYQDLVDYVIEPYLFRSDIDDHTKFVLNDYLRNLGTAFN